MIDINKRRNNFQKLPILKPKCDYFATSLRINSTKEATGSKSNALSVEKAKNLDSKSANCCTPTNPVREANQHFFLVSDYKDKNFLKEECEIAHAQVLNQQPKTSQSVCTSASSTVVTAAHGEDIKNNNSNNTSKSNCNNTKHNKSTLQTKFPAKGEITAVKNSTTRNVVTAKIATGGAATINGMRRSGNANHVGTTATAVNVHKIDLEFNKLKSLPKTTKTTTTASGNTTSSVITSLANSKSSSRQIKPLVHRTIPTTAIAAVDAATRLASHNHITFTNSVNNNTNGNNNTVNGSSTNNNMQSTYRGSLDHDDIKYIDSDEPPANTAERKQMCDQRCYTQQGINTTGSAARARARPKSTIICSATNQVFEKVNNYKYANGSNAIGQANFCSPNTITAATSTATNTVVRRSGIDSSGIKASIDKFNSFSEQKRLPFNSVQLRSHSGSGSTSNLQHRHSSDFDNCNLRLSSGTGGGSLTRAGYRTATSAAVPAAAGVTTGKFITSMHTPTSSAALFSTTRVVLNSSSNSGSNSSSLPTRGKNHETVLNRSVDRASPSSLHTKDVKDYSSSASSSASSSRQDTATANHTHETKKPNSTSVSVMSETDDSIRSSTARSVLPPLSPTAGRYLDRESTRTSTYSSSIHNNADEVNKASSTDEKAEGLCGLKNIGNTCFMNSIIQCLSHTSELTKFLKSHNGVRSSPSKDQQILYEFARLIRDMWSSGTRSVTPMELKRSFSAKHRMYSDYNQQDAQEFLRFFLDSLHCALNNGVKGGSLKIDESLSDNKKADLTWEWYSRQENSLIRDLFVGQLKSTLKCTICNNASVTFDPFWDLSVPLPSSSRCKLDACLDLFIREEVLDGDEMPTCSKCRTRRKCTKSFTIQRFPKYLVIHLKRFSETRWSKLSNIVEFPTGEGELNMGPYASNKSSNIYYSLYAISNHMGSTAGGHYVALCKHPASKKWHEFNDNVVSDAVPESHLTSSSAYILFYERM